MSERSESVAKIRAVFRSEQRPLTLRDIRLAVPDLQAHQISSVLCYLLRQRYVTREQIKNEALKERKKVWSYTYSDDRHSQPVPHFVDIKDLIINA